MGFANSTRPIGFTPVGRTSMRQRKLEHEGFAKRFRLPKPSKSDDPAYRKVATAA